MSKNSRQEWFYHVHNDLIPGYQRVLFLARDLTETGACLSKGLETFRAQKANFKIKTCRMVAQFLAYKPVNLASLTVSYIASFSKLLKIIDSFPGQKS